MPAADFANKIDQPSNVLLDDCGLATGLNADRGCERAEPIERELLRVARVTQDRARIGLILSQRSSAQLNHGRDR